MEPNAGNVEGGGSLDGARRHAEPPQRGEGEPTDRNVLGDSLQQEVHAEVSSDRHRLKASDFTGNEDIEQFIQEFSDVAITQWPSTVALLQL